MLFETLIVVDSWFEGKPTCRGRKHNLPLPLAHKHYNLRNEPTLRRHPDRIHLLDIITSLGTERNNPSRLQDQNDYILPAQQHPIIFYESIQPSLNTEIEVPRAIITQV